MELIFLYVWGIVCVWLIGLSIILFRMRSHYKRLIQKTGHTNLDHMMETILEKNDTFEKDFVIAKHEIEKIKKRQELAIQKIGFLRFNPFERMGGEQSIVVSLLNGENTGIILNFLYTRDGVRVYAKEVMKGENKEHALSSEEKESIKKAT